MRNQSILCPTDFSPTASHAITYAVEMAEFYHVKVQLLHVVNKPFGDKHTRVFAETPDELIERMEKQAAEQMQEYIETLDANLPIESMICHGEVVPTILASAKQMNAGMIVIASHGRTGLNHFLNTNTAEKIVNKAYCPVLVVK
ncbi:universal stress protein [Shewanella pneumatophori]|uniref:Universal stress protein n=1 Tax=Shewanella pneumatophori TaxID=314092 RepID=A0A9X2CHV5_9GAMM|nr:universal stress protein [Shewanella pneumatophori]MCL1138799.1 universal stress protein [Shewanella pneumatophori]